MPSTSGLPASARGWLAVVLDAGPVLSLRAWKQIFPLALAYSRTPLEKLVAVSKAALFLLALEGKHPKIGNKTVEVS
jgi:hypothetical protein